MLQAQDVMHDTAALLNDQGLNNNGIPSLFTYAVQMPYLNIAIGELREALEQNNVQVTDSTNVSVIVPIGTTQIPLVDLPTDLIEIQQLWERTEGCTSEDYLSMTRLEYLPPYVVQTTCLVYWTWQNQILNFIGALIARQLRIDYVADVLPRITDPTDSISVINAKTYLTYRNAALCAEFIGENTTRATSLNGKSVEAFDRFIAINTKGKQAIATRRRPFMQGFRGRRWY
jgi:hypothetical protein